jgi:hypothetical protein
MLAERTMGVPITADIERFVTVGMAATVMAMADGTTRAITITIRASSYGIEITTTTSPATTTFMKRGIGIIMAGNETIRKNVTSRRFFDDWLFFDSAAANLN